MTTSKSLPTRPSQESLRKQAKRLVRDISAGNAAATARARAQLPNTELPLSQRDAQLVVAREYGFAGWQDLSAEVRRRLGKGVEWALVEAGNAIHENDVGRLKQLIAEYPALLSCRQEDGCLALLHATVPYAMDVSDPEREKTFFRPQCTELLIDAGARVEPSLWERAIQSGALGMLSLLERRGALPRTLPVLAALGDLDAVRASTGEIAGDLATLNQAFMNACRFKRKAVAAWLLDRTIELDADLGRQIEQWRDRSAFVEFLSGSYVLLPPATPWRTFVARKVLRAIDDNDLPAFARWLCGQPWLLEDGCVHLQVKVIELAASSNREAFLTQLIAQDPAVLHSRTPPKSTAILFAFDEGNAHLIPLLRRIWPLPDDLPHAAGAGDFDRVKRWFDEAGKPALGDPSRHHGSSIQSLGATPPAQQVLDTAFAWACLNHRFEIAEFLLGHGANINTTWNTHEAASVLHIAAAKADYELARFLIDHGIDMTIQDYRWGGTAEGWAYHVGKDRGMHEFLAKEEEKRGNNKRVDQSPHE
jgi:hypothetical protein